MQLQSATLAMLAMLAGSLQWQGMLILMDVVHFKEPVSVSVSGRLGMMARLTISEV